MLGRFAFTSSFSRRSSCGFRVGSRRFGFSCCERGPLGVFTKSIPIHPLFAIQSRALADPSILNRTVPWRGSVTLIWGPSSPQSPACMAKRFLSPLPPAACLLANAPVVFLGKAFATRLPLKAIHYGASCLFAVLGLYSSCER